MSGDRSCKGLRSPHRLNAELTTTMPSSRSYFRYFRETLVEMARVLSQSWRAPHMPYP